MELKVLRLGDNGDTTLGAFYINGILKCGTVEDEERAVKVSGETRVPNGKYKVALRKEGGYHQKYTERYGDMHKGMLCIYNKPGWVLENDGMSFKYILIHTGNTDEHTAGCLLLNDIIDFNKDKGSASGNAYKRFYPEIAAAIEAGEEVTIEYIDVETGK
jgi:hypothetical protein